MGERKLYQLILEKDGSTLQVFDIAHETITIGRHASNHVVIEDPNISRQHARIIFHRGQFILEDLGSVNGTWLNRKRLLHPVLLQDGDVISLGPNVHLRFVITAPVDVTASTSDPGSAEAPPIRVTNLPSTTLESPSTAPPASVSTSASPSTHAAFQASSIWDRIPVWGWTLLGVLIVLCSGCVAFLWWVDTNLLWCVYFGWLLPGCP